MPVQAPQGYAKGRIRRAEILDQAISLFGEAGYRGASLRELAGRCGLSHTGLLHYFPNKEALLLAVLEHRDEIDHARVAGAGAGLAVLRSLVELASHNATRPGLVELFAVLSAEATAADHPAHAYFAQRYLTTVRSLERAYQHLQADGALRPGVDPDPAARQLVALMDGLQIQWLFSGRRIDMAAILGAHIRAQLTVPLAPADARPRA